MAKHQYPLFSTLAVCGPALAPVHVEDHALRQRKVAAVVDGVGLPPHVGLPRVGAGLAAAARCLLAAECAADLGARRPGVDVGDAAVRALSREAGLGLAQIGREEPAERPCGTALLHRDRLLEVAYVMAWRIGAKISSATIGISEREAKIVGWTK